MIGVILLCSLLAPAHHCTDDEFGQQAAIPVRVTQTVTSDGTDRGVVPFLSVIIEQATGKAVEAVKSSTGLHEVAIVQARDETLKALSTARKQLRNIEWPNTFVLGQHPKPGAGMAWMEDPRVTVDIDGKPLRDALKTIFANAKLDYLIEREVPADGRVTVKVINVRLSTALNAVTEAIGVGWTREMRMSPGAAAPSVTYRVLRSPDVAPLFTFENSSRGRPEMTGAITVANRTIPQSMRVSNDPEGMGQIFSMVLEEERSTFNCPHCHGQVTAYRQKQTPRCPTCQKEFRAEWKYCPSDGAPRPVLGGAWRFCPICGKSISFRKP